ncbi:MAG: transposase, partial [Bacteroidales bacterium]|nr:transposase [Bacteroidales bacterium]
DGKFYVSVLFEYEAVITFVPKTSTNAIGLDYKSDGLYMDSNGSIGSNHKYYRQSHDKLAKAQRRLSRKCGSRKGEIKSNNYIKQQKRVARIHRHIANQRLDDLHKLSTEIANQYDIVCVESLNMRAMSNKDFGNGKATLDNGYGLFLLMLEYKLADRGKYFVKVNKWYSSSQLCSCCGNKHKLALSERVYTCSCGLVIDRDLNAAINIRNEGLRLLHEEVA